VRVFGSVLCCALGLAPALAHAQTVTPLPLPSAQPAAPLVPDLHPAPDLSSLAGKPVTRVSVVLEGNVWNDLDVPSVRSVKLGEPLTPALARRALDELLATGRFARGRVTVTREGAGALLAVRVTPRKLIQRLEIDLHGARVEHEELLRDAGLSEGGEVVGAELGEASTRIERDMALHGYPAARANVQTRATDDPTRTLVLVDVLPGAPRRVDQREIYVFAANREAILAVATAYGVRVKDRADAPVLDAADTTLEQALHARGWYRARVSHDLVSMDAPGRSPRVVLRVRVDAGPLQVAQFEGNEHYDATALGGALGLDVETDRSPSHLADKVRAF